MKHLLHFATLSTTENILFGSSFYSVLDCKTILVSVLIFVRERPIIFVFILTCTQITLPVLTMLHSQNLTTPLLTFDCFSLFRIFVTGTNIERVCMCQTHCILSYFINTPSCAVFYGIAN